MAPSGAVPRPAGGVLLLGAIVGAAALLALAMPADATTQQKTLRPDEAQSNDTYVTERHNDTSFGNSTSLFVNASSAADLKRARTYIRFALGELPRNGTVQSAELQISYQQVSGTFQQDCTLLRTLEIREVLVPWNEQTLTWDNQPALNPEVNDTSDACQQSPIRFSIRDSVKSVYDNPSAHHGWLVKDKTEGEQAGTFRQHFRSSSDSSAFVRPALVISLERNDPEIRGLRFDGAESVVTSSKRPINISAYVADPKGEIVRVTINGTDEQSLLAFSEVVTRNRAPNGTFNSEAFWRNGPLNLTTGNYTFNVTAVDSDSHSSITEHTTVNVTVENALPGIENASASPSQVNQSESVLLSVNATDLWGIRGVTANVTRPDNTTLGNLSVEPSDVNGIGNGRYELLLDALTKPGAYNVTIYVEDLAGNVNSTLLNFTVRDITAPVVSGLTFRAPGLELGLPAQEAGGRVNITVRVEDDSPVTVTAEITAPGGGRTVATMPRAGTEAVLDTPFSEIGIHAVKVNVTDVDGNTASASGSFAVVPAAPPSFSAAAPAPGGFGPARPTLRVEVRDLNLDPESVRMLLREEDAETRELPATVGERGNFTLVFHTPGGAFFHGSKVIVAVEARDSLGLQSTFEWNFTVDAEPPVSEAEVSGTLRLGGNRFAVKSDGVLAVSGSDVDSGLAELRTALDSDGRTALSQRYGEPVALSALGGFLGSGNYTLRTWGVDNAGNAEVENRLRLLIDDEAPALEVTREPGKLVARVVDAGAGVETVTLFFRAGGTSFDEIPLSPSVSDSTLREYDTSPYARGTRIEYRVVARDLLGNEAQDGSAGSPNAYVEGNHPPQLTLLAPLPGAEVAGVVGLSWKATDADGEEVTVAFQLRPVVRPGFTGIEAGLLGSGRLDWDTRALQDGRYVLRAEARDPEALTIHEVGIRVNNTGKRVAFQAPELESGQRVRVKATILEETVTVLATIRLGEATVASVPLTDDGAGADETKGDGTWSAFFTPERDGEYRVTIEATLADGNIVEEESALRVSTGFGTLLARNWLLVIVVPAVLALAGFALFAFLRYRGKI